MNAVAISKYLSYLLRHNPEDLPISKDGFVPLEKLLKKLKKRFPNINKHIIMEIVSQNPRFEIKNGRIRALYGHTIDVDVKLTVVKNIKYLYHGTTRQAANKILKEGLKPMKRKKVHLSPSIEQAMKVGMRRARNPVILRIDAESAIREGIIFEKANELVYLSGEIPPKFISEVKER
ncbi:MAG: RNA 2'-phosphotransferase [Thermoplasmata archaeon]|nr:MAG: RNA 2'-phosphotransferase [Thermoplasmata archaeon]